MTEWQKTVTGISYNFTDRVAHVVNDETLKNYLDQKGNQSLELATELKSAYQNTYGKALDISTDSLAIEILGHVFVDDFSEKVGAISKKVGIDSLADFFAKVEKHTDVIDCGEKAVDDNRSVWDRLVPVKSLVFAATE